MLLFVVALAFPTGTAAQSDSIAVGGDVSFLQRIEDNGGRFFDQGSEAEALDIFRDAGYDLMRLRLWHSPADGYGGLDTTIAIARRIVAAGQRWILDFHYSDSWADPGKQNKPAAWLGLLFDTLVDSVYTYTKRTMEILRDEGIAPEYVQIGNEITTGMLWPDGSVGGSDDTPAQWQKFAQLLDAGIRGARDGAAPGDVRIVIHIDRGADVEAATWFFDNLTARVSNFDAIGLSYYPFWHGGIDRFQYNLEALGTRYAKEILVVEVAYPWTLQWFDDETNLVGSIDPRQATWPATPQGQAGFLREASAVVRCAPHGSALVYWEPEHVTSRFTSPWENMTLFDQTGETLPGLRAMSDDSSACSRHYASIRLPLNAAAIPDTVGPSTFEVRGVVDGFDSFILSDGTRLDWTNSQVTLHHVGGDYYAAELLAPVGREVQFKYWSAAANAGGFNAGWDTGETNADANGNSFITATADTTLPLHFFNADATRRPYDWRPWQPTADSVVVWFRVYMLTHAAVDQGYAGTAPVTVGTDANEGSFAEPVVLDRERPDEGTAGYDLYSGVVFFPVADAGTTVSYRFCISASVCEQRDDRAFSVPAADTTLRWVRYADSPAVRVGVENEPAVRVAGPVVLHGVWPNPAWDRMTLEVETHRADAVRFALFDVSGRRMAHLGARVLTAGHAKVELEVPNVPNGVYFVVATTTSESRAAVAPVVVGRSR